MGKEEKTWGPREKVEDSGGGGARRLILGVRGGESYLQDFIWGVYPGGVARLSVWSVGKPELPGSWGWGSGARGIDLAQFARSVTRGAEE